MQSNVNWRMFQVTFARSIITRSIYQNVGAWCNGMPIILMRCEMEKKNHHFAHARKMVPEDLTCP